MSLKKISTDIEGHIRSIIANRALDQLNALSDEKMAALKALLDDKEFWRKADNEPQLLEGYFGLFDGSSHGGFVYEQFIFRNCAYSIKGEFTPSQKSLLVQDHFDSERRKFERLQHKFNLAQCTEPRNERTGIPEDVRVAVWRRDNGRCVRCGSRERLEYDHIVPVSRGGSSTVRNIELLCEMCNRSKGANIQ